MEGSLDRLAEIGMATRRSWQSIVSPRPRAGNAWRCRSSQRTGEVLRDVRLEAPNGEPGGRDALQEYLQVRVEVATEVEEHDVAGS